MLKHYFFMKNFIKKSYCIFVIALFFSSTVFSQYKIYGKVMAEGEPLIGATIYVKELQRGEVSQLDGKYEIQNVESGFYNLEVNYGGYENHQVAIRVEKDTKLDIDISRKLEFDELIVSATRAGETTPMTYTNITKEELEENNLGQDVPFLLKWTPSVVVTSDAGTGMGYTGIRVRGSDPSRINVTINGIPLNDSESQGVFWVDLPDFASSTEDIQIQRGVGTSTNGAGAFGGSINLNTSKVHQEAYGKVAGSVGSFGSFKSSVQFGSGLVKDKFTFDGRLSKLGSDGYIDRAEVDLSSYYLSAAYIGNRTSIRLNTFSGHEITYQAWNGVPAQYVDNEELRTFNTAGAEKSGEPHFNEVDDYTQTHYQAIVNHQLRGPWNFNGALHYTKGEGFFEQYKAGQEFAAYGLADVEIGGETLTETDLIRRRWLDNDFYGFTYALNYAPSKFDFTLGGAWNIYKGKHFGEIIWAQYASDGVLGHRYYDNDAEKTDFNIFGKLNTRLADKLYGYLDLQYRRVGYEFVGLDADGSELLQDETLNFFNPKLGLTYELKNNAQTYLSFAVANREPNRSDYTESPANQLPLHETLYNTELGYRQNFRKTMLSANAYWMQYDNQLVLTGQLNDVGEYARVNVEDSYRIGLELEAVRELMSGLTINASATFSQNKIKSFTEYIDNWDYWYQDFTLPVEQLEPLQFERIHEDTDLAFSPNLIFTGGLSYDVFEKDDNQQLTFSLSGKYVGEQFIDNTSNENTKLDSYFYSDFRIGYTFKTKWIEEFGITLLVRNVFDARYSTNAWTYRYRSAGYDGRPDDPFTRLESDAYYNLTGFYPQAGRNYLLGVNLGF